MKRPKLGDRATFQFKTGTLVTGIVIGDNSGLYTVQLPSGDQFRVVERACAYITVLSPGSSKRNSHGPCQLKAGRWLFLLFALAIVFAVYLALTFFGGRFLNARGAEGSMSSGVSSSDAHTRRINSDLLHPCSRANSSSRSSNAREHRNVRCTFVFSADLKSVLVMRSAVGSSSCSNSAAPVVEHPNSVRVSSRPFGLKY